MGFVNFERSFGRGGRIHPFGGAGVGYGNYTLGYRDNSVVEAVNAGVDYYISRRIAVKAEWQYQFWDLGDSTNGFNPKGVGVGLLYRLVGDKYRVRH
jgi:opacity protein-like surface antigen